MCIRDRFGLMKMIVVTRVGTYVDGMKVSEVGMGDFTAEELQHLKLRIGVEKRGRYQGCLLYTSRVKFPKSHDQSDKGTENTEAGEDIRDTLEYTAVNVILNGILI